MLNFTQEGVKCVKKEMLSFEGQTYEIWRLY
jgi:hypothetical protein